MAALSASPEANVPAFGFAAAAAQMLSEARS